MGARADRRGTGKPAQPLRQGLEWAFRRSRRCWWRLNAHFSITSVMTALIVSPVSPEYCLTFSAQAGRTESPRSLTAPLLDGRHSRMGLSAPNFFNCL